MASRFEAYSDSAPAPIVSHAGAPVEQRHLLVQRADVEAAFSGPDPPAGGPGVTLHEFMPVTEVFSEHEVYSRLEDRALPSEPVVDPSHDTSRARPPRVFRLVPEARDFALPTALQLYTFPRGDPAHFPHSPFDSNNKLGTRRLLSLNIRIRARHVCSSTLL